MDPVTTESLLGAQTNPAADSQDDSSSADAGDVQAGDKAAATPADGNPPADKADETPPEDDKPAGAPETYEAFTMPDGYELDAELLGEFTPVLKDLNLPQEAAQKVIDFAPKLIEKAVKETTANVLDQLGMTQRADWAASVKTDKEIGGPKLAENLAVAQKAMSQFASPELKAVLNKTGLGNHPELIRAFVKVGKAISEDGFVPGGKTRTPTNAAVALYDKSTMNP